ncbi:MAG: signal peptide peptidase SppA [Myxococcota bacterium]
MLPRGVISLAFSLGLTGCILYSPIDLGALGGPGELRETVLEGTSGPKIVLVDISGVISDESERPTFSLGERPSMVAETKNVLDRAADDDSVAALLLRINSPGGSVWASDTIYHELMAWKAANKKPVVAFFNGMSASGAYYLAMAADRVVAHPAAVTGSIGVIMPGLSFEGLMEKYGVADQTITSGRFKDTGSMFRDMRPDERAQMQSVIDDLYARFTDVVAQGRPGLDAAKIHTLADGRVYSARQALAAGLVDELGYLDDAVKGIEKRANIKESRVVEYHRSNSLSENVYSRSPDLSLQALALSLAALRQSALAPGFYYLWPGALTP